jgi:glycosyltransferase involved in cell wall biosynthesis
LDCLDRQEFPRWFFNVIVIDDHSTDSTVALIRQYYPNSAKVLISEGNAVNSHKKKALETGIKASGGDLIVTN